MSFFLEQQVGTKQPVVPTGCSTKTTCCSTKTTCCSKKSYFFLMEQLVEFLEQLVGTTGRFVPAGCSDQLFRPVVPKNKKFFDGTSGRKIGTIGRFCFNRLFHGEFSEGSLSVVNQNNRSELCCTNFRKR